MQLQQRRNVVMGSVYLLAALVIAWTSAFLAPHHEWDEIAYAGVASSYTSSDPAYIHDRAYASLREVVSPATYRTLTDGIPYRAAVAHDAAAFTEQLAFYRSRVLYCGAIYLLDRAGINAVRAAFVVSAASYAGLALLLSAWLRRSTSPLRAAVIGLIVCASFPFTNVARSATPDALNALVICCGVYVFQTTRSRLGLFALLTLAVLVRYDSVLFGLLFAAYFLLRDRETPWKVRALHFMASAGSAFAAYGLVARLTGAYGWPLLFHHTFIAPLAHPAGAAVSVHLADYLRSLVASIRWELPASAAIYYVLLLVTGAVGYVKRQGRLDLGDPLVASAVVFLANMALRPLLFPAFWDRFFVAHYAVFAVVAVQMSLSRSRASVPDAERWAERARLVA